MSHSLNSGSRRTTGNTALKLTPTAARVPHEERMVIFDRDAKFCKELRKFARKANQNLFICYNNSDFWHYMHQNRDESKVLIMELSTMKQVLSSRQNSDIADVPTILIGNRTQPSESLKSLPIKNVRFIQKRYGPEAVLDAAQVLGSRCHQAHPFLESLTRHSITTQLEPKYRVPTAKKIELHSGSTKVN